MDLVDEQQTYVATALIRNNEGKILLQKRVDFEHPDSHNKWEFPGGGIEFGETPEIATIRECMEEIGCRIRIIRLLPYIYSKTWDESDKEKFQIFIMCYEARIIEGVPTPSESEVSAVQWYTKEEIATLDKLSGIDEFVSLVT